MSLRLEEFGRARIELEGWLEAYRGHVYAAQVSLHLMECYQRMMMADQITEEELNLLCDRLRQSILDNYPESPEAKSAQRQLDRIVKETVQ